MSLPTLKLHLPFNGDLNDDSGDSHNGTWTGGGSASYQTGPCGTANGALTLDGAHYVELASPGDLLTLSAGLFFCWVNLDAIDSNQAFLQINDYSGDFGGTPPRNDWRIEWNSAWGSLQVARTLDDSFSAVYGDSTVTASSWHSCAAIMAPSAMPRLFIDGSELSVTRTGPAGASRVYGWTSGLDDLDSARVGSFVEDSGSTVSNQLDGGIAGVQCYSGASTPGMVKRLHAACDPTKVLSDLYAENNGILRPVLQLS